MMWNEKQFFNDFAASSGKIKADSEFKEHLKQLPQIEERKKKLHIERLALAAAAVIICVTLGTIGISQLNRNADSKTPDIKANAMKETETELISGGTMIVSDKYDRAIEYLENTDTVVTAADGKELTASEKEALLQKVKRSVLITRETKKEYTDYFCMEENKKLEIRVYEGIEDEISIFEN